MMRTGGHGRGQAVQAERSGGAVRREVRPERPASRRFVRSRKRPLPITGNVRPLLQVRGPNVPPHETAPPGGGAKPPGTTERCQTGKCGRRRPRSMARMYRVGTIVEKAS
jgi:hypothetical protein